MTTESLIDRRAIARELSTVSHAGVHQTLAKLASPADGHSSYRIAFTGPPGAGKSTLIGLLAQKRVQQAPPLAVIAIDPSSPKSRGSLLGDRIRMDSVVSHPDVYIRSLPSGEAKDGLTDNLADILAVLDRHKFAQAMIETVGVGQVEYGVRTLVDTVVLVMTPGSGDQIQAMKAGILETADICVINKADLPGAERMAQEIRGVLHLTSKNRPGKAYRCPILLAQSSDDESIANISSAIDDHQRWLQENNPGGDLRQARMLFHVQSLVQRRVSEISAQLPHFEGQKGVPALYKEIVALLWSEVEP